MHVIEFSNVIIADSDAESAFIGPQEAKSTGTEINS